MLGGVCASFVCVAALLAVRVEGQDHTFQWNFGPNFVELEFTECKSYPVFVESITNDPSALGVAPYYLIAFEVGGIPTTTMVGSDPHNLSWTANHKQGATLMLTMVDSTGNTGGISPTLYNITNASGGSSLNTSCVPSPPLSTIVSVHPNVTDKLTTCEPWGLTIQNGTKPYSVVLSAVGSTVITNITMGPDDDVVTWIDRADPNGQLMASVVDASGQWGVSSDLTRTAGSTDTNCTGLVTTSQTSAQIAKEAADAHAAADANRRRRTHLIVGLIMGLGGTILVSFAIVVWLRKRRLLRTGKGLWDDQDVLLPFTEHADDAVTMQEIGGASPFAGHDSVDAKMVRLVSSDHEFTHASGSTSSAAATASYSTSSTSNASPPLLAESSAARYRKILDASHGRSSGSSSRHTAQTLAATPQSGPTNVLSASLDPDIEPDIIIQHRDGGVIQELPPPYADRYSTVASPAPLPPDLSVPPEITPTLDSSERGRLLPDS